MSLLPFHHDFKSVCITFQLQVLCEPVTTSCGAVKNYIGLDSKPKEHISQCKCLHKSVKTIVANNNKKVIYLY